MDTEGFELVSLLCSRLCHDLVSPVGAVGNGLEVLADENDAEMREMAMRLITQSAQRASNKLQFARLAYGASGGPDGVIDLGQAREVTAAVLKDHQVNLEWRCEAASLSRMPVKLLANCAFLAAEALPRGGGVAAALSMQGKTMRIEVAAEGPMLRPIEGLAAILAGDAELAGMAPKLVQAYYTGVIARLMKGKLTALDSPERLILQGDFLY